MYWKPEKQKFNIFLSKNVSNNFHFLNFRLSYHQRVLDSIPDSFAGFAPEKPEAKYKYDNPEAPENGEF